MLSRLSLSSPSVGIIYAVEVHWEELVARECRFHSDETAVTFT